MWRWSPECFSIARLTIGILHVCGGDPILEYGWNVSTQYSPRMWRWSCILNRSSDSMNVFSTYVEVILNHWWNLCHWSSILHVCGGDPLFARLATLPVPYSPRMWRWSCSCSKVEAKKEVFSTYVEVILVLSSCQKSQHGILHVCGGDPVWDFVSGKDWQYSPCMWRWS